MRKLLFNKDFKLVRVACEREHSRKRIEGTKALKGKEVEARVTEIKQVRKVGEERQIIHRSS